MTFHLFLPQMRMPVDAIVERALAAEAAGFEGLALMDHLAPPLAAEHDMWEAMTAATWLLSRTRSLVVGHLVLCDPLRHPAVLARQAATLDHASGGRFELGIGWGSVQDELVTFGVGSAAPRERVARLGESLDIIRALWSGEPVSYDGRFFQLRDAQQRPAPTRPIPIVVGGVGGRTLEVVRAHADWWNVPIHQVDRLDERKARVGRARVSVQTMVAVVPTEADRAAVSELVTRRFGGSGLGDRVVVGTTGELAAHFGALRSRGVERFYVWFADFAPPDTLRRFGEVIDAAGRG
ncbi:MAG TPA: LLM class flavin-dependent oxidoreductase [Acidimicrobiales bacterium]|jgi:alkanesulfonate monooxygenase SsuD/methylene tetrahydromethanopterin reductase-like flavin-dependent oxidoreductase (luciferase family)|nr:LLM class flavin-dependent oxidoreductase [Acidimicrobiales bacterium]